MEQRRLGRTDLRVSVLGYGCGAIGGLMVRGEPAEQEKAIGRALDLGVNYFDTAFVYGEGASETNLGRTLRALKVDPIVGTKVRIFDPQRGDIAGTIATSLEDSLRRLGRDSVDLFQLHNPITLHGRAPSFTDAQILAEAVPALRRLREQGKIRHYGITGIGDAAALRHVLDEGGFATAQIPYNLLNPSAAAPAPAGMPDLGQVIDHAASRDIGVIGIRVLAGGALSGSEARHPVSAQTVEPIASGASYAEDVAAARRFLPLVEEGHAADLVEAALRFAIGPAGMSLILVGSSSTAEFEHAAAAVAKGRLPEAALSRIAALRAP
ncbi:aldo/keto reductase [Plastoroseomonas hellenica]|uniref:aldo/keto reductase n=1 Tax=Plastoroseomonas hellenica TaxID=2687306 RepID=UPI001BADD379|nr:aldo/keto reductase [Plastoroseomonas hellenica]MBR0646978.1 aldo/keto reductase [Plastoroseomonas hellenica]